MACQADDIWERSKRRFPEKATSDCPRAARAPGGVGFVFFLTAVLSLAFAGGARGAKPPAAPVSPKVDRIVVRKAERTLTLYSSGKAMKSCTIALGRNPVGNKQREGDGRTPEGIYKIVSHNPNSKAHRSLLISYPDKADRARAKKKGVKPGGKIVIHGLLKGWGRLGKLHLQRDWTYGCIAVTNEEMDEIYRLVPDGTPIEILP